MLAGLAIGELAMVPHVRATAMETVRVEARPADGRRSTTGPGSVAIESPDAHRRSIDAAPGAAAAPSSRPLRSRWSEPPADAGSVPLLRRPATTLPSPPADAIDPFAPLTSPNVGEYCAASLEAADLTEFFANPIGSFQGADYQRAFRLGDDRVLWTFQDAFISGTLVHNVGMVQSGRCFTMLNAGARSWLLGDATSHMSQWHWIFDGGMSADGATFHLFVVQMNETGSSYLSRSRPTSLRRVVLDSSTLEVLDVVEEEPTGDDLYGWAVTSDAEFTYLYSHCYQQFGFDTLLGFGECVVDVKLARVPLGEFDAEREYWGGDGWTPDHLAAEPVVGAAFVYSGNNPAQIRFDGERFVLVEKRDDWWGETVEFGVADDPQGPFAHVASVDQPLKCDRSLCSTYFAAWLPWNDADGNHIWSIGHNRWNGSETSSHLDTYRPTFFAIDI
jgi:hypothetical protein